VLVEVKARILGRNDRVRFLEDELEKKKELMEKRKDLKKEEFINTQLRYDLKEEKLKLHEVSMKVEMITYAIFLKHPNLAPPEKKYELSFLC
ncbi:hypothetical protein KI387_012944, partial [Taxus chinensis]